MRGAPSFLLGLLAITSPAFAGDGWVGLKAGMTRESALAILGQPLLSHAARGYESWIFDHQGDVTLYHGRVLFWIVPQTVEAPRMHRDEVAAGPGKNPKPVEVNPTRHLPAPGSLPAVT